MANHRTRHFDASALKLIRVVTASYFMAVSLGLISGVDASQMFQYAFHPDIAALTGSVILFTTSFFLLGGMMLRLMALVLAMFVLSSSVLQNFLEFHDASIDAFWRDLVLVCSVLLSYGALSPREVSRAAVVTRSYKVRHVNAGDLVLPRRVLAQPTGIAPQARPAAPAEITASAVEDPDLASEPQDPVENNVFRLRPVPASDPAPENAPAPEASESAPRPAAKAPRHLFAALVARKKAMKSARAATVALDGLPKAGTKVHDLDSVDDAGIDDTHFNIFADDSGASVTHLKSFGRG